MRLLKERVVSDILRGLTKSRCHFLLSGLTSSLVAYSKQQASLGGAERGPIFQPQRSVITTANGDASLFMPSSTTEMAGVKVVTVPRQGDIRGVINVFAADGGLTGLLSAAEITAFRTALATMALLARTGQKVGKRRIVVFGAGKQAEWHARLVAILFPDQVQNVTLVNRGKTRLEALHAALAADWKRSAPGIVVEGLSRDDFPGPEHFAEALGARLRDADVISCCTPSTEPLFAHTDLRSSRDGQQRTRFISLIGSYKPHMQEIDAETLLSGGSKVYVDSRESCLYEAGEITMAGLTGDQLVELGECCAEGQPPVEAASGENMIFKCVGMGIMDLVVAKLLLEIAAETSAGEVVDGF